MLPWSVGGGVTDLSADAKLCKMQPAFSGSPTKGTKSEVKTYARGSP